MDDITENYDIYFMLIDMSKAFDTVKRSKLLYHLSEILTNSELHILKILIMDVKIKVKVGNTIGREIITDTGIAQGDCLSALLFIYYLAIAIRDIPIERKKEDFDGHNWSELDWLVPRDIHNVKIDPKYADDLTFIRSEKIKINIIKRTIPTILGKYNLQINEDKTEEYQIKGTDHQGDNKWKECKLLGSMLDTEVDIQRRKVLAIDAYKSLSYIFESKKLSIEIKVRTFNIYVRSVFLYNSELWTLTETLKDSIDIFQRKQLKKILGIYWPQKITKIELYQRI